ncbi:MAG: glycosyltransferase [Clostridia bacterium]|nr:glycosyltransferase [Clostridia bacterium]
MKKIIIVNNNMKVGGVQKSLYNLLWEIEGKHEVTLCLFHKSGTYVNGLPPSVKIVEVHGLFRYLGVGQRECGGVDFFRRGLLVALTRLFGRTKVLARLRCHMPELEGNYDCAISYLHNGRAKSFYGGTQDFVLRHVSAKRKIAFLHGDYRNCGANNLENNKQIQQFDQIVACSEGCLQALLSVLPQLKGKCVTVRNFHRFDEIYRMAGQDTYIYDEVDCFHVLMVSRLSREKGIDRAIRAVASVNALGLRTRLHIVGDGREREGLRSLVEELDVSAQIIFHGEQNNPYRYMKNADLLMMTSYHEAAPLVIDEARSLGIPILTTETTSSKDMVTHMSCGWVCDNTQEAINETLCRIVSNKEALTSLKRDLLEKKADNSIASAQFAAMLEF